MDDVAQAGALLNFDPGAVFECHPIHRIISFQDGLIRLQISSLNDALATKEAKISEAAVSDGSGVGGTAYISTFGYRWIYKFGPVVCISVNLTAGSNIPAWTQFAAVQSAYRTNMGMGRLDFAAYNLTSGAVYPINLNPSSGAIETDSIAIPSGATIRFYLTYII